MMIPEGKFCSQCGGRLKTSVVENNYRPTCSICGTITFYDPKLAVAIVLAKGPLVLLIKRATEPGLGKWALPGGYVDRGELVEHAAKREMLEETGIDIKITGLIGLFSEKNNPVILAVYSATSENQNVRTCAEVLDVNFFNPDDLPTLAFKRDLDILVDWKTEVDL